MSESAPTDRSHSREPAPEIVVDSAAHRLIPAVAVAALVVLAPLPFGSAHGWSLWAVHTGSLVAAGLLLGFEGLPRARRTLQPLLLPAAAFLVLVGLQLLPLPLGLLRWISPSAGALYAQVVDSPDRWFAASANPHASVVSIVRLAALAGAFSVAAFAPLPGRRSLFYWSIVVSGGLAAALSWWHAVEGWNTRLFGEFSAYQAVAPTTRLHWPLLNPNHLAASLNVTWLVALGAFLHPGLLGARPVARESQVHRTIALGVVLLAASASYATHSRGGLAAAAAGLAILALRWPTGTGSSRHLVLGSRALAGVAVLVGIGWLLRKAFGGVDQTIMLAALQRQDATLQVRLEVLRQGLAMLRDFALLGTGLGTWGDAFPRYQLYPLLFAAVTHAHCDLLEWVTDMGFAGAAVLAWLAFMFVREPNRDGHDGDDGAARRRAILSAALGSLIVHATGDFALRVPSVAIVAAVLLGLHWRESRSAALAAVERYEPSRNALEVTALALGIVALVYLSSWEWRDERLLGRLAAKETIEPPANVDWRVLENLSRRQAMTGDSGLAPALEAVWRAPASSRAHHALAYGYESDVMRERELRRTVLCEPSARFWRLEHALALAALGRFALARKAIEEAFYFDPQYGNEAWLRFQDPTDRTWPFLEAALRGVRRRVAESPETMSELRRFETLQQVLLDAYERRRHGRR